MKPPQSHVRHRENLYLVVQDRKFLSKVNHRPKKKKKPSFLNDVGKVEELKMLYFWGLFHELPQMEARVKQSRSKSKG